MLVTTHRILDTHVETKLSPVGECIYCRRKPPETTLSDEHIIADGFGGDLILPDASCPECAKTTGRVEQLMLRQVLQQPRGVFGIMSRKKRTKQTSLRVNVANDSEPPVYREVPFNPDMPAFLTLPVSDFPPGILRGASKDEIWTGRLFASTQSDFNQRGLKTMGEGRFRFGFRVHAGVFGQLIAKTCHAFAIAHLGIDGFRPFLTDFVRAHEPPFDGYHLASLVMPQITEYLHEITLETALAQTATAIGITVRNVYVVKWRIFGQLSGPLLMAVVGEPT